MLTLRGIKKDYSSGDTVVHALKGVTLDFRKTEFVSILGQSGCGKTTLLNIIGGLDHYTSGDLLIDNRSTEYFKDSDWDSYRNQKIGFVFQSYNLVPHLSVLGNVELSLTITGVNKQERKDRAVAALERVGLGGEIHKRPNQLSGGQMQRVAIARALVNDPDVILADEPTGALDSTTSVQVMELLKEVAKDRLVIMVTHNRSLAEEYSTRIISMMDGRVIDDNNPFVSQEATEYFKLKDAEVNTDAQNPETDSKAKDAIKEEKKRQKEISRKNKEGLKRTSMNFFTALALSWGNLISKKGRTAMTAIASSIGIIGVALVLSLSNGFSIYIDGIQTQTLSAYPVTVSQITADTEAMLSGNRPTVVLEEYPDGTKLNIDTSQSIAYHYNLITQDYVDYVDTLDPSLVIDVTNTYGFTLHVLSDGLVGGYGQIDLTTDSSENMMSMFGMSSSTFQPLMNNSDYVLSQYDVIAGKYPTAANEAIMVVNRTNSVRESVLQELGLKVDDPENADLNDLIGQGFKVVKNDDWYVQDSPTQFTNYSTKGREQYPWEPLYKNENNIDLKIVGVMRVKETAALALYNTGICYTQELLNTVLQDSLESKVVKAQKEQIKKGFGIMGGTNVVYSSDMGKWPTLFEARTVMSMALQGYVDTSDTDYMTKITEQSIMSVIGGTAVPMGINFYPVGFNEKTTMNNYLLQYNDGRTDKDKVLPLDASSLVSDTMGTMIDMISYVLVGFAAISLVVSTVMIAIITYVSVIERTKEIGVLRAVGARKMDIARVFNAETFIIGLAAGLLGVFVAFVLTFPLSIIIQSLAAGAVTTNLAVMSWWHALSLTALSVVLTLVAGLIPAHIASKKDPVVALRSE